MWWEQAGIDLTGVRERAVADTDKGAGGNSGGGKEEDS